MSDCHSRAAAVLAVLALLTSCTTMESSGPDAAAAPDAVQEQAMVEGDELLTMEGMRRPGPQPDLPPDELEAYEPSEPTIFRGTDEVFRQPAAAPPVRFYGDDVSLNFEQAPLTEIVHAVLGDILELDYIVEHPINGQVTLRTRSPVPRDELLGILESLLKANQALMIRDPAGRIFVSGSPQMRTLNPGIDSVATQGVGYSTVVVPLQYISAGNMAEILRPLAEDSTFVRIDNLRNILMLAGTQAQLAGYQEIITTFDVDLLAGMSVGIFPVEYAPMEDVEAALNDLMGRGDGEGGLEGIGNIVRLIPVARLNSILVVTPRAHYLQRIGAWIERLDREPDANFERRLYVYPVQNTSASHLASLLSTILGGGGGSGGNRAGVAPGLTPETVSGDGGGGEGGGGSKAGQRSSFSAGSLRVTADEKNNALLIFATGKEYAKIKPALERLDVPATQVIIEASIIEVTLNDELRYGLEWTFNSALNGDYRGTGLFQAAEEGGIGAIVPGFSYSVVNSAADVQVVLNALAQDDLLNIISSPSVMVLDNETANIEVGNDVPVLAGTGTNADGDVLTQNIQYRSTGVKLAVTPSVNAGGMVTMTVDQSISDVAEGGGTATNPVFFDRKITSIVAVRSTESVVLGGLISENKSQGRTGIPILHDLPLVGPLFGTTGTTSTRTELLVVITPRVIFSDADLRDVSREMRRQMRGLDLIDISDSSSFLGGTSRDETESDN